MVYAQNEILLFDNEWSSIHNNIDQCYKHNGELKGVNIEEYTLNDSIYIKYMNRQNKSMLLEVRTVNTLSCIHYRMLGDAKGSSRVLVMFTFWSGYLHRCDNLWKFIELCSYVCVLCLLMLNKMLKEKIHITEIQWRIKL